MPEVVFRQLLPTPGEIDAESLIGGLDLDTRAPVGRPYIVVNFVATADGSATFQGRSGGIGDEGDRAMFHALREPVDAVLAGTGTLRTERYGRILGKAERRRRRLTAGRPAEPLACLITRSGELPLDIPLFAEPEARIVVFSPRPVEVSGLAAQVEVEVFDPETERPLHQCMRILRESHGVRSLLCEGGPSLFGALLHEQLVDELFLTVAPKLDGGSTDPSITTGEPLPDLAQMRIVWLLERQNSLYLRYRVTGADPPPD